jgi:hypothetical protein
MFVWSKGLKIAPNLGLTETFRQGKIKHAGSAPQMMQD